MWKHRRLTKYLHTHSRQLTDFTVHWFSHATVRLNGVLPCSTVTHMVMHQHFNCDPAKVGLSPQKSLEKLSQFRLSMSVDYLANNESFFNSRRKNKWIKLFHVTASKHKLHFISEFQILKSLIRREKNPINYGQLFQRSTSFPIEKISRETINSKIRLDYHLSFLCFFLNGNWCDEDKTRFIARPQ